MRRPGTSNDRALLLMRLAAAVVVLAVVGLLAFTQYYDQAPWQDYPSEVQACGQQYVPADVPSPRYVSMAQVREVGAEERAKRRTPGGVRAVLAADGEFSGCAREAYLEVADGRAMTYTLNAGF